ncbi:MAG: protein phosphatase 2C domain-containing protein [Terracidiphilus sp.]|jgi:protein phosphatase
MSERRGSGQSSILFAEECDRGTLREENQDSVLHVRIAMGDLMIVAGGVGGYPGGATASRMAVEHFYAHLAALPREFPVGNAIRAAAARANEKIFSAAKTPGAPKEGMGATVVLAVVQEGKDGTHAWIGHIGDSRAYLMRAGRLHLLTIDHSAAQDLLSHNIISKEEAQRHPDAAVLTRSLGLQPEIEIDIEQHPLAVGDTLLLCSDGLWGFVPEREIQKVVETPGFTLETAAHNLLELALAAGGHDNIGIELARLISPADGEAVLPPKENYIALKAVIVMLLIAFAALCVLVYLTFFSS